MVEEINVSCPGCDSVFSVPIEFCGETAECAECGVLFEIPLPHEKTDNTHFQDGYDADTDYEPSTDTGPIKGVESKNVTDTTNTVKLSRTGIGMIPEIKDSFQFAIETRPPAFSKPKPKSPPPAKTSTPKSLKEEVMLPRWVAVNLRKNEEVIAVKETTAPAFTAPAMVAAATFLTGIIATITMLLTENMYVAFTCALAVAAAAFIVTFFMSAKKRRQALVLTDERAIYIGDKRIEAHM